MQPITIALDAMGGDHGPSVVVPAALAAVERLGRLEAVLVGDSERLEAELAGHPAAYPALAATSSRTGQGVAELRASLAALAGPRPPG